MNIPSNDLRQFVRTEPAMTRQNALTFARSVMWQQQVYTFAEMATCESALAALTASAVDLSEHIAIEVLTYAMESRA